MTQPTALMETHNGIFLDVLNPDPSKISLTGIAHALSRLNRFAGFPHRSISVAEHSWHASYMVDTSKCPSAWEAAMLRLQALLHDATEGSGLVDLPSPIKLMWKGWHDIIKKWTPEQVDQFLKAFPDFNREAFLSYYEIEARLALVIGRKFGVELVRLSPEVKAVDARLCITEKLAFIGPDGLENPAWTPLTDRFDGFRFSFLPRWLDKRLFPKESSARPTVYYHWFMWPGRAKSLFIKRYIELAKIAHPALKPVLV